eukprot:220869-Hanusia_phi.AAC.1
MVSEPEARVKSFNRVNSECIWLSPVLSDSYSKSDRTGRYRDPGSSWIGSNSNRRPAGSDRAEH